MTCNYIGSCKYCKTIIRLRYQASDIGIPVAFDCPKCGVEFNGYISFAPHHKVVINNLLLDNKSDIKDAEYILEQSAEFLQKKIKKATKEDLYAITPFIRTMALLDPSPDRVPETFKVIDRFMRFKNNNYLKLKDLLVLYKNNNMPILLRELNKLFPSLIIINELDSYMKIHHELILGLNPILNPSTLDDYITLTKNMCEVLTQSTELIEFLNYIRIKLNAYEREMLEIIDSFVELFEKLLPIILIIRENKFGDINKEELGLTTIGYSELNKFYADSYEKLLRTVDIIILLNNISVRGSYKNMLPNNTFNNPDDLKNMSSKKYNKIDLLIDTEPYTKYISFLNNRIRNAINHATASIDKNSQLIKYEDNYNGNTNTYEIYYVDLAKYCYENFTMSLYLLEIIYNIKKIDYIVTNKIKPNIEY